MGKNNSLYVYSKGLTQADCSKTSCDSNICYCDIYNGKGLGPNTAKKYVKSKKKIPSTFPMKRFKHKLKYYNGVYMDCYGKPCKSISKKKAKCKCTKKKGKFMTIMSKKSKKKSKKKTKKRGKKIYINGAGFINNKDVSLLNPSHLFR